MFTDDSMAPGGCQLSPHFERMLQGTEEVIAFGDERARKA